MRKRWRALSRWLGWTVVCLALVGVCLALAAALTPQSGDWLDALLHDPQKNWVGLLLMSAAAGWVLARLTR